MKEHPILMSTPMVQAILEGRKTKTRRVLKLQPDNECYFEMKLKNGLLTIDYNQGDENPTIKCPYGEVGDVLWVRETFEVYVCNDGGNDYTQLKRIADNSLITYATNMRSGKHPSLHFPKGACRLFLEITDIRVERLQDISEEDAIAEGVGAGFQMNAGWPDYLHIRNGICTLTEDTAAVSFGTLWESINGKESWEANPFVWVIEFKKI